MMYFTRKGIGRLSAGAVGAVMMFLASHSYAATLLGSIDSSSFFGGQVTSTAPSDFDYMFTLAAYSPTNDIDVIASPVNGHDPFSTFTINLYQATTSAWTLIGSTSTPILTTPYVWDLSVPGLSAGSYLLDIVAAEAKSDPAFGGTLSVNPVPLPGAIVLFGAAIAGLGGMGWHMGRKGRLASTV